MKVEQLEDQLENLKMRLGLKSKVLKILTRELELLEEAFGY
jgi:hypothetical protein